MFTRQHYKAIADILKANRYERYQGREHRDAIIDAIVNDLCVYFKQDNSHFDRDKFTIAAFSPPTQYESFASNYKE